MTVSPERLAEWRSQPHRKVISRWENRTYSTALRELARRHPAEFLGIIDGIREADPRPEAEGGGQRQGEAA